jgi:uncharacterized protein (DUF2249 family)
LKIAVEDDSLVEECEMMKKIPKLERHKVVRSMSLKDKISDEVDVINDHNYDDDIPNHHHKIV